MNNIIKKQKGITLIALVITIIVLLILAGITITMVFGDNGILTRSKEAKEKHKMEEAREEVILILNAKVTEYEADGYKLTLKELATTVDDQLENKNTTTFEEDLQDKDSSAIVKSIEGEKEKQYLPIQYKGYDFKIDGNLKVLADEEIEETEEEREERERKEQEEKDIADFLNSMPEEFFIVDAQGTAITGINSDYIDGNEISYDGFKGVLVIPSKYKEKSIISVTGINGKTNIEKLYFQEGLQTIGYYAFDGCSGITGLVDIPEGVTTIDKCAFQGCTEITEIKFPSTLQSVVTGTYISFYLCENVTKITIPQYIAGGVTIQSMFPHAYNKIEEVKFSGEITSIRVSEFENCSSLSKIDLPNTVTSIGGYAFRLTDITEPKFNSNITRIEDYTYDGCYSMTGTVDIPEGVTFIGRCAFQNCTEITEVKFPSTLQSVVSGGYNSFYLAGKVTKITIPQYIAGGIRIQNLLPSAYDKVEEVDFSGEITSIGTSEFENCSSLSKIDLPNTVTSIGGYAFRLTAITEPKFSSNLTRIEEYTYDGCYSMTGTVDIPEGVTFIGRCAFQNCIEITEVKFPSTLQSVVSGGYNSFYLAGKVTKITIPQYIAGGVTIQSVFPSAYNKIEEVKVLNSVTSIANNEFSNCSALQTINIDKASGSISNSPWGAPSTVTVNWLR